jgi:hypothetical protein
LGFVGLLAFSAPCVRLLRRILRRSFIRRQIANNRFLEVAVRNVNVGPHGNRLRVAQPFGYGFESPEKSNWLPSDLSDIVRPAHGENATLVPALRLGAFVIVADVQ